MIRAYAHCAKQSVSEFFYLLDWDTCAYTHTFIYIHWIKGKYFVGEENKMK